MFKIDFDDIMLYEDVVAFTDYLAREYSSVVKVKTVGYSADKRRIDAIILGQGKPLAIISGGIHGRESLNTTMLLQIIWEYIGCIRKNAYHIPCVVDSKHFIRLMKRKSFVFVPLVNPDGYMIALKGPGAINDCELRYIVNDYLQKNSCHYSEYKQNACGIDINRDFFNNIKQPETQALINVFENFRSKYYLDFHSRGNVIYYYRNKMGRLYNRHQKRIAREIALCNGYKLMPPSKEVEKGDTYTNSVHYFSQVMKGHSFTVETVRDEASFPLDTVYLKEIFAMNCYVPLVFTNRIWY